MSVPVDPNVFFYTFSTVAQALAGAFGFLAAIVLYQLQSLNTQLRDMATRLMDDPLRFNIEPYRTLFINNRWDMFLSHLEREADPAHPTPTFKNLNFLDLGAMRHVQGQVHSIRRWFIVSMFSTVGCISFCLIFLLMMAWFQNLYVLAGMVWAGIMCLFIYGRLVYVILQV